MRLAGICLEILKDQKMYMSQMWHNLDNYWICVIGIWRLILLLSAFGTSIINSFTNLKALKNSGIEYLSKLLANSYVFSEIPRTIMVI